MFARSFLIIFNIIILLTTQGCNTALAESPYEPDAYIISNGFLVLEYDAAQNAFKITDRSNRRVYMTEPAEYLETLEVKVIKGRQLDISMKLNEEHGNVAVLSEITLEKNRIKGLLKAPQEAYLPKPFRFPGAISGNEENQRLVIPYAEGIYVPADEKNDFGNFDMWGHKSTMPFTGMTDSKTGIMITSGTPCDTSIDFTRPEGEDSGNYLMGLVHWPSKGRFGYDRLFYIDLIEKGGYNEMAKKYRRLIEEREPLKTLRDKAKENRNVRKLIGAVDFWLGADEMKSVAIIEDLISGGIGKALVNFQYGWKVYDREKRPEVVEFVATKGLLPSRYDNYTCIYSPTVQSVNPRYRTEGFYERVIIKEDGNYQEGFSFYYKGQLIQGYRMNTGYSSGDAEAYLDKDLKENAWLGRFVDVVASASLYEDYSQTHPMTRSQDMKNRRDLLESISSGYDMITGTEETAYWAVDATHYSEGTMTIAPPEGSGGDWSTPTDDPGALYEKYTVNPAVRIPLKSLVYHDCHVSGWYTGDGISKVPEYWRTKELLTILYGTMNLVFPTDVDYWNEYKTKFLRSIRATGWVFEKVGFEKMESHRFLTGDGLVQKTVFSNGMEIIVNFSDYDVRYGKLFIGAEDFVVINGKLVYTQELIEGK